MMSLQQLLLCYLHRQVLRSGSLCGPDYNNSQWFPTTIKVLICSANHPSSGLLFSSHPCFLLSLQSLALRAAFSMLPLLHVPFSPWTAHRPAWFRCLLTSPDFSFWSCTHSNCIPLPLLCFSWFILLFRIYLSTRVVTRFAQYSTVISTAQWWWADMTQPSFLNASPDSAAY